MRFVLEVSDPLVMKFITRFADSTNGQWDDAVRALILAGGQVLYPAQGAAPKTKENCPNENS